MRGVFFAYFKPFFWWKEKHTRKRGFLMFSFHESFSNQNVNRQRNLHGFYVSEKPSKTTLLKTRGTQQNPIKQPGFWGCWHLSGCFFIRPRQENLPARIEKGLGFFYIKTPRKQKKNKRLRFVGVYSGYAKKQRRKACFKIPRCVVFYFFIWFFRSETLCFIGRSVGHKG